jgi:HK97 family phage major capsid protein
MAREISDIRVDLDAAKAKAKRLASEQLSMVERGVEGEPFDRIERGFQAASDDVSRLEDEWRDRIQYLAGSGGYTESGNTGAADSSITRFHANLTQGGRPYDARVEGQWIDRAKRVVDGAHRRITSATGDKVHALLGAERTENFDPGYVARRLELTESDAYKRAFMRVLAAGQRSQPAILDPDEAVALRSFETLEGMYDRGYRAYSDANIERAMSENVTTAGGFGVPILIDPSVIITSGAADVPLLRICRVEQVTNNLWQGISTAGMTWSYSTEGTEVSDNSPTLAQPTVRVHMAKGFLPYSIEVSMDVPDFMNQMSLILNSGYNDLLATKTMTGTGTNEPYGIFVAMSNSTSVLTPTTDGQFGGQDIFATYAKLPERYRANATWVMSVNVQNAIRQFAANTTSVQSAYFTVDMTAGTFRINEKPVVLTDYAPLSTGSVPGTTGLQNILMISDFTASYVWAQRMGMSIEPLPALTGSGNRFPTGQRGLFAWSRNGGNSVNNRGSVLLQNQ